MNSNLNPQGHRDGREAAIFVGLLWLTMSIGLWWFVEHYGTDVPIQDDWANVAVLTQSRPMTASWLWSQHNEHRVPLPRLLEVGLAWVCNQDFLAVCRFNAVLLMCSSLILIISARMQRGWTEWSDSIFPLLFLHWGHRFDLQIGFALNLALASTLACVTLSALVWDRGRGRLGSIITVGLCALCSPLCGAAGLAMVPALAIWLGLTAVRHWKQSRLKLALVSGSVTIASLLLVMIYFWGYREVAHHKTNESVDFLMGLSAASQFLTNGWGATSQIAWPISGWLTGLGIAATLMILMARAIRGQALSSEDRWSALGLGVFLMGSISLAIGIGWGRSGLDPVGGFSERYAILAAPAIAAWSLACSHYSWTSLGKFVQFSLFATALVFVWPNSEVGTKDAKQLADKARAFQTDVERGVPPRALVAKHAALICPSHDQMLEGLNQLRTAKIGVFRKLAQDPPTRALVLNPQPTSVRQIQIEPQQMTATGVDPWLEYRLPEPTSVVSATLAYSHSNPIGSSAKFRMEWLRDGVKIGEFSLWSMPTGDQISTTIQIVAPSAIDQIRIQPDNQPCRWVTHLLELAIP